MLARREVLNTPGGALNSVDGRQSRVGSSSASSLVYPRPVFEVNFDMNPQDPEFDAQVHLAIDEVMIVTKRKGVLLNGGMIAPGKAFILAGLWVATVVASTSVGFLSWIE